jgi:Na+/glutamate symporter
MTNASSTYLGIVAGAIIGGLITWWVYNRQNKTSEMQDELLNKIAELEKIHIKMLERIEALDNNHDAMLQHILKVDETVKDIVDRYSR